MLTAQLSNQPRGFNVHCVIGNGGTQPGRIRLFALEDDTHRIPAGAKLDSGPTYYLPYALAYIPGYIAALSNRTIDDLYGDSVTGVLPTYEPSTSEWNAVVQDNNCTICVVQPDAAQMVDHSWHDTTVRVGGQTHTVSLQFTGTGIYFFGGVPNTVPNAITVVNLTFSLDGAFAGSYTHIPDPTTSTFLYSVPMLAMADLSNTTHTLIAEAQVPSLLIFDYAMYT
ncbi:hypothetical protein C8R45DRAFT_834004, partial [Mycena sanguinolenta]